MPVPLPVPRMNTPAEPIRVEVAAAWPDQSWSAALRLPHDATVAMALAAPAVQARFPQAASLPLGIFSRRCTLDQPLRDGDRIELYRPLLIDPKRARRERAEAAKGGS